MWVSFEIFSLPSSDVFSHSFRSHTFIHPRSISNVQPLCYCNGNSNSNRCRRILCEISAWKRILKWGCLLAWCCCTFSNWSQFDSSMRFIHIVFLSSWKCTAIYALVKLSTNLLVILVSKKQQQKIKQQKLQFFDQIRIQFLHIDGSMFVIAAFVLLNKFGKCM